MAYNLFAPVGYKFTDMAVKNEKPNLVFRIIYTLANLLLFRPLKDKHGLSNVKHGFTSGATISPDIIRFLRAMGINLKQLYALTETGVVTSQRDDNNPFDSVGVPVAESKKLSISPDGEILIDALHCFDGYYKDNIKYPEVIRDGWFYSSDAGYFRDDNHLIYRDRMTDLKELSNGTKFSPQNIEARLKASLYIIDAMVVGTKTNDFIAAIINLNLGIVGRWAGSRGIHYSATTDLSQSPEVCELIRQEVVKTNRYLPEESKVKKFINIHKEFDPDEAELTRTRKIRRAYLEHRYQNLIDAIYGDKQGLIEKTTVTYQDGSKGALEAVIKINTVGD
jgi:long-chain acyl-CoA synthetase